MRGAKGRKAHGTDDFAPALREAIAARGVSLDHLRRILAREGITVSVATLSYWQSGRSRPERASSLAAIGPLEEALGLPRGFLASRLPGTRGRVRGEVAYERAQLARDPSSRQDPIDLAVARLGVEPRDVAYVSVHDRFRISSRTDVTLDVRALLTATCDGVDRYPVWMQVLHEDAVPVVSPVTNCRVGRVLEFPDEAGMVAEMLLDRPLAMGETTLVEHRLTLMGVATDFDAAWRRVTGQVREVVMEVRFDPGDLPAEVTVSERREGRRIDRPAAVHPAVQAHFVDPAPGRLGVTWVW